MTEEQVQALVDAERVRNQSARLIRGFLDVAAAAQQERTPGDFFRVVRERLHGLGLTSTVFEVEGDRFRFAPFFEPVTDVGVEMRVRLPGWTPLRSAPIDLTSADGLLVDDFPSLLGHLAGLPRSHFLGRTAPRALMTAVPVNGAPAFVLSCAGEHLDGAVAGAFGLLGRQLGAALESALRIEELDRRNAELSLLFELGREVVGALDLPEVLQKAAHTAAQSLRCSPRLLQAGG